MAASPVNRRYTSAVYEDKYFPAKNAAIPFKWETSPGRPKFDDEEGASKDDDKEGSCMHNVCNDSYTFTKKDNNQCIMQESHTHYIPQEKSIYPLRPPPKLVPTSPLRVKDLLLHSGMGDLDLSDDHFDDDQLQQLDHCPLHAYHRGFSRLSFRLRSLKASTVVPVHKNYCVIKPQRHLGAERSQASRLVVHAPFQGRSQSFSYAAMHGAITATKGAANGSNVIADASVQAPGRRCNSFNVQSARKTVMDHDNKLVDDHDDVDDDPSSMAAAAVWAGACILAAAAVHDVVSADPHQHVPCRVAMKLRDLMQQSANFSELELPTLMKLKRGGGNAVNENLAQLALCSHTTVTPMAKRKTKSLEEEVMKEAFLREGMKKSCTHDDDVEDEPTLEEKTTLEGDDLHPHKLVKKNSFFKVFKNECIACWCPSSTL